MSIEKVLNEDFVAGAVSVLCDETEEPGGWGQEISDEQSLMKECSECCCFLFSMNPGPASGIVDGEWDAVTIDYDIGRVSVDSIIERRLMRIATWASKSFNGRQAKRAVFMAYLDVCERRDDITFLLLRSACDEMERMPI